MDDDALKCCCGVPLGIIGIIIAIYMIAYIINNNLLLPIIGAIVVLVILAIIISWIDDNSKNNSSNARSKNYSKSKLDINKATPQQLKEAPFIKPDQAEKLLKYRRNGDYVTSFEDLQKKLNLSDFDIKLLKDKIIIRNDPNTRFDINKATLEQLKSLPDITTSDAKEIINDRKKGNFITSFKYLRNKFNIATKTIDLIKEKAMINGDFFYNENSNTNKININNATIDELKLIPEINQHRIDTIINLRKNGKYILTYNVLEKELNLSKIEYNNMRKNVIFSGESIIKNKKDKAEKEPNKPPKYKKVKINTAPIKELMTLPEVDYNMANKIIELRRADKYIESHTDLKSYLRLTSQQLGLMSPYVIFEHDKKKTEPQKKPVDINKATKEELMEVPLISPYIATIIINKRSQGEYITSLSKLQKLFQLTNSQISKMSSYIIISNEYKETKDKPENKPDKDVELDNAVDNKIDINTATEDELSQINGINRIMAKKIVQMREVGNYVTSFKDLQDKLRLKDYQIRQIKKEAVITKSVERRSMGRRLDL